MRSRPFQTIEDELGMKLATLTQGLFFLPLHRCDTWFPALLLLFREEDR